MVHRRNASLRHFHARFIVGVHAPARPSRLEGVKVPVETPWVDLRPLIKEDLTRDLESGNHVLIAAPTGGGKTTLATKGILPMFTNVADILVIDSTADPKLRDFGKPYAKYGKIKGLRRLSVHDLSPEASAKIHRAMNKAYKQGECVVFIDEIRHIVDPQFLRLRAAAESMLLFSRKRRNVVIGLTQAPRWIPSAFYDQTRLQFIFRIRDKRAMLRLAEIGGDTETLKAIVPSLAKFEFAYVNSDGDVTTSKFDIPKTQPGEKKHSRVLSESAPTRRIVVTPSKG
jgi:ATPase family protein associated with various cellular activities (AAA)